MNRGHAIAGVLFVGAACLILVSIAGRAFQPPPEVRYPPRDEGLDSLAARAQAQSESVGRFQVDYDFRFTDQIASSGITFVNHPVDDAGLLYKADHYDHGNGIAAADVDGDGLTDLYFVSETGGNELWKNLGGGRFQSITQSAGVGVPGRISITASFADIDNDGDQDLFVTTVRGGNLLFENDGHMDGAKLERALDLLRAPKLIAEARAMAAEQVKIARGLLAQLRPSEYRDSLTQLIEDQIDREV